MNHHPSQNYGQYLPSVQVRLSVKECQYISWTTVEVLANSLAINKILKSAGKNKCKVAKHTKSHSNKTARQDSQRQKYCSRKTLQGKVTCCRYHERAEKVKGDYLVLSWFSRRELAPPPEARPQPSKRMRTTTATASC